MNTNKDTTHLVALMNRLSAEKARHADKANTEWYKMYIAQIEKEIAQEFAFLGMEPAAPVEMSDEDILKELGL